MELAPKDTTPANLFDLNERTVVFMPDGYGGWSRSVLPVKWEEGVGREAADGEEIPLPSFSFDFAGRRWGSFFVSQHGLITFGKPLTYSQRQNAFGRMAQIARDFVTAPTISPLFKPNIGGYGHVDHDGPTHYVAQHADRVVVTWTTSDPEFYVHGATPDHLFRFQVVLGADGTVRFNYSDVTPDDGIVGLFPDEEVMKGHLIASIADPRDSELPGHLDLLDVAIYESNTDALIVEWTMRDRVPAPPTGTQYSYRLYFDTDKPYFDGDGDSEFMWSVDVATDDSWTRGGMRLPTDAANKIALLVGDTAARGIRAGVKPDVAQFDDGRFVQGNWKSRFARIRLPNAPRAADLSRGDRRFSRRPHEVFHYVSPPDTKIITCRVVEALGDEFDVFVLHTDFRFDTQESAWPWTGRADVKGIGVGDWWSPPCGEGRLKGYYERPVWIGSQMVVDVTPPPWGGQYIRGLAGFGHEVAHSWTAFLEYMRDGEREPLYGDSCSCHWRRELHTPAAFPWNAALPSSLMGGHYWRDNGDGTFTPVDGWPGGGFSWLDLYAMGLARADEVPDMFLLRNPQPVNENDYSGPHAGEGEMVTIEQVIAAMGRRKPPWARARKVFNAAFVYILKPGEAADPDMLALHAEHRDKVIEYWSHITGGRSRMTTTVPSSAKRVP